MWNTIVCKVNITAERGILNGPQHLIQQDTSFLPLDDKKGAKSDRLRVMGEVDVIADTDSLCRPDIIVQPRNRQRPRRSRAVK
ncbi:hypothetical protein Glove_22g8 [Diversispora epigaea]|uniref:Uncharacterized protein n=1 Tax=Diversispora epigaea TaxID=1348612 RepID=A0A397JP40_9GLOM|nr:hypothetical protein Glove_22g8 [Diversispora epigaea]